MERKLERRGGLGRGLSALMADVGAMETPQDRDAAGVRDVPIERVKPNPDQPRRHFSQDALSELADSIREKGVLQPLLVRDRGSYYEIVAGERRWRASQIAKLRQIPVLIREYTDTEVLEVAIIENIQRADLGAIEEASAYRQLMDRFGHTQEKLAESLSKSRSHVANCLRLLTLPKDVLEMVEQGTLSAGHARALVGNDQASSLAKRVVEEGMTVRAIEALVREKKTGKGETRSYGGKRSEKDDDTIALETDISETLGMQVKINHDAASGTGMVTIQYRSLEDLDLLCQALSTANRG